MNLTLKLINGEIKRLISYKILPISLVTAFIWVIIFLFLPKEEAQSIAPLLIYVDVTMMSILLIGASVHLEKQEGTIKSMIVMPLSLNQILSAKIVSGMVLGLESVLITSVALFLIHGISFNYFYLFLFVLISSSAHALLGYFFALNSKDFTSMLGLLMAYLFPFAIPTILFAFGVIDAKYEWILLISPSHSANYLISSVILDKMDLIKVLFSSLYLIVLSFLLYQFVVYPKFKSNAVRG